MFYGKVASLTDAFLACHTTFLSLGREDCMTNQKGVCEGS